MSGGLSSLRASSSSSSTAGPSSSASSSSSLKASHHLVSGALSGLTSAVMLQPLDLLKTRLQQSNDGPVKSRMRLIPIARQIVREDGPTGLWRGTIPTLARNVPGVAIYFYSLSAIRGKLASISWFAVPINPPAPPIDPLPLASSSSSPSSSSSGGSAQAQARSQTTALVRLSSQGNLLAGAIARTSVGFVLNPITVLKARYESGRYADYTSLTASFRSLLRQNGLRGLFQGFTATAARDAPYAGLYLVFYEKGKDLFTRVAGMPSAAQHSASGASAACIATLLTSPADCVKTRMQVNPLTHPTLRQAVTRIYADRGIAGFFSGSTLRISRKAASSAIAWTVYEALLLFLRDR